VGLTKKSLFSVASSRSDLISHSPATRRKNGLHPSNCTGSVDDGTEVKADAGSDAEHAAVDAGGTDVEARDHSEAGELDHSEAGELDADVSADASSAPGIAAASSPTPVSAATVVVTATGTGAYESPSAVAASTTRTELDPS